MYSGGSRERSDNEERSNNAEVSGQERQMEDQNELEEEDNSENNILQVVMVDSIDIQQPGPSSAIRNTNNNSEEEIAIFIPSTSTATGEKVHVLENNEIQLQVGHHSLSSTLSNNGNNNNNDDPEEEEDGEIPANKMATVQLFNNCDTDNIEEIVIYGCGFGNNSNSNEGVNNDDSEETGEKCQVVQVRRRESNENLKIININDKNYSFCIVCGCYFDDQREEVKAIYEGFNLKLYETFLSKIYQFKLFSESKNTKEEDEEERFEHPFCEDCVKDVIQLKSLHQEVEEATINYNNFRDDLAKKLLTNFCKQGKKFGPTHGFFPDDNDEASMVNDLCQSWKLKYTGAGERIRQREEYEKLKSLVQQNLQSNKMKGQRQKSFSTDHGTLKVNNYRERQKKNKESVKQAMKSFSKKKKIQSSTTGKKKPFIKIYLNDGRNKNSEMHLKCPICEKAAFTRETQLLIHLRIHMFKKKKTWTCSNCAKSFIGRKMLLEHRKTHMTEDEIKLFCRFCNVTFNSKNLYKTHMKTHSDNKNLTCEICKQSFSSVYFLKKHANTHSKVDFSVTDLYTCKECSKTFLRSEELNEHFKVHDDANIFGCNYCGKPFENEEILKSHTVDIHTGENFKGNPYLCLECGQRYSTDALLVSHLKNHRPKEYICQECGKACRSRDGLRKHEMTHDNSKKPFFCSLCNIGFIERKSYDCHMVKHNGILPYQCNLCVCVNEEGFKESKDLRMHKVTVHPETISHDKKFTCTTCWNGFSTQENLDAHVKKIHERYRCTVCARVFKLGDHLKRHMFIHTGEKPFLCEICNKSFNQESNLKEHMYRHLRILPHQCPYCIGKGFLRKMHLKEHMLKEHGTAKGMPSLLMGRAAHNARKNIKQQEQIPIATTSNAAVTSNEVLDVSIPNSYYIII